jgi:hypothetical protein
MSTASLLVSPKARVYCGRYELAKSLETGSGGSSGIVGTGVTAIIVTEEFD